MKIRSLRHLWTLIVLVGLTACGGGGNGGGGEGEVLAVGEVVARDAAGVAIRLGQNVATEGVAIVEASLFANNKLKLFIQDGTDGVMVFHATSAGIPAFAEGDRLRVSGRVIQADPTSDSNRAMGTVAVDITDGTFELLEQGVPLPAPRPVTCANLTAGGEGFVGTLVRLSGVRRVDGEWPAANSRSAEVTITDDGTCQLVLRMQRNTIDAALADVFAQIGDGAFELTGIVVQDDTNDDGDLHDGMEVWLRGVKDVAVAAVPNG